MQNNFKIKVLLFSSLFLFACSEKVNKTTKENHHYKDLTKDLQESQDKESKPKYRDSIGEDFKKKITEFENHFNIEIKYISKDCLRVYYSEDKMIESLDYLMDNLKYPKFSNMDNVVLDCGMPEFLKPGFYGRETPYNHLHISEFYQSGSNSLISDNSYDSYAEPIVKNSLQQGIDLIESKEVSQKLLIDNKLVSLACNASWFIKGRSRDYEGLKEFLTSKKGEIFSDFEIPALSNLKSDAPYLFSVLTNEGKSIRYSNFGGAAFFKVLADPKKEEVLGNVLVDVKWVDCLGGEISFRIELLKYNFKDGTGKLDSLDVQEIRREYDGKISSKISTEKLNPFDDFMNLDKIIKREEWPLPEEDFAFDTVFMPKEKITVGILDTGLDYNHPSLYWRTLRQDGQLIGFDGYDPANHLPYDHLGHGTHVAGIAVKGSQSIQLVPMRMDYFSDEGNFLDLIDASVKAGVRVINASLGWFSQSQGEKIFDGLIKGIKKYPDVIFVIAAGNESANLNVTPIMPACLNADNLIVVAAVDSQNNLAYFSNFGKNCVDVAAPGVEIMSSVPSRKHLSDKSASFDKMSGTSMASPFVTNVVAKMLAINPKLKPKQVKEILKDTSFKTSALKKYVKSGGYVFPENTYRRTESEK